MAPCDGWHHVSAVLADVVLIAVLRRLLVATWLAPRELSGRYEIGRSVWVHELVRRVLVRYRDKACQLSQARDGRLLYLHAVSGEGGSGFLTPFSF